MVLAKKAPRNLGAEPLELGLPGPNNEETVFYIQKHSLLMLGACNCVCNCVDSGVLTSLFFANNPELEYRNHACTKFDVGFILSNRFDSFWKLNLA